MPREIIEHAPARPVNTPQNSGGTGSAALRAAQDEAAALLASLPREHVADFLPMVDRVTTDMIAEIQQAVPAYAQPLEGYFGSIMVAGVENAVRRLIDAVGVGARPDQDWARLFRRIGKVEFHEGRSLDSLQTAYRVGGRVAWRHIADWGIRRQLPMTTLSVLAEAIFAYIDEISKLSIEGYTKAQSESARVTERKRRKLVELVLGESPPRLEALGELAAAADWQVPTSVAVAVIEPVDDQDELVSAALLPDALVDLDSDPARVVSPDPERHLAQLGDKLEGRRTCVGPTVRLQEASTSLRLARRALDLVKRGIIPAEPVVWCDDHLSTLCVLGDEFLITELLNRTLRPLQTLTSKQRERTAQTTLAWLEARGNVPDIAKQLDIHPQTVRYRMRQVDDLFGDQLDDPDGRLALEIALRTRKVLHASSH